MHQIFHPHEVHLADGETRLDRQHHVRLQQGRFPDEIGAFMEVQACAVPEKRSPKLESAVSRYPDREGDEVDRGKAGLRRLEHFPEDREHRLVGAHLRYQWAGRASWYGRYRRRNLRTGT